MEADDLKRAEGAAKQALRKLVGDDRSEATTDSEAEDDEDYGPLTAFDGQMKIDIDFVVVVPHKDEDKEDVFIYPVHPEILSSESINRQGESEMAPFETPPQSASSGESTPMDFSDEMESLKVELKKAGQLEEPKSIAQRDVRPVEPGQGVSTVALLIISFA